MNCNVCKKSVSPEIYDALEGMCEECYQLLLPVINERKIENIKNLAKEQPYEKRQENGKVSYACYLPEMIVFDDKSHNFHIDFDEVGLKRIGNLIGMAGFYYDSEYYWATTPESILNAWNWFNIKTESNDDYWMVIEGETVWDFLQHNCSPYATVFRESLIVNILSLITDLHTLESLGVDVTSKLLEIKNEKIKGNMDAYQRLSNKAEFHTSAKAVKIAFSRIRKVRQELANLSSETRLALFAKHAGFQVTISKSPDLLIDNKRIEVKKPKVKFVRPKKDYTKHDVMIIINEDDSELEDLSSHIRRGFDQKADIVAIEVNHLDRRTITGFNAKWLGQSVNLEKALRDAIAYQKKGIVLLFKCRREGYRGRVLRCKKA